MIIEELIGLLSKYPQKARVKLATRTLDLDIVSDYEEEGIVWLDLVDHLEIAHGECECSMCLDAV
jgi:7,8-dihydro-6-hydroxymethylpterin-pyrophosphokinase